MRIGFRVEFIEIDLNFFGIADRYGRPTSKYGNTRARGSMGCFLFSVLAEEELQETVTAVFDIAEGDIKGACIPRVGDVIRSACVFEELMDAAVGLLYTEDTVHVAVVGAVHANEEIESVEISGFELLCGFSFAGDAVRGEHGAGIRVDLATLSADD